MTTELIDRMLLLDAEYWWTTHGMITPKKAVNIKGPSCNTMQVRLFEYYRKCRAIKKPCLVLILKPRQKGASTIAEGLIYHHMRHIPNLKGLLMGDVQATSDKVFEMYRQYAKNDDFGWGDEFAGGGGRGLGTIKADKDGANEIVLENGSKYYKETAGSPNAGRSGTVQVGHWDEECFYPKSETRDPMLASLNSFYDEDEISLGIRTSTANGPAGSFYDDWNDKKNDWFKLFAAWFEFEDSKTPFRDEDERREFVESMEDYEVEEMERFKGKISLEHMNWYRKTLKNKCKGDVNRLRQEYPSDARSCFLLSARPRFDMVSLNEMREVAERTGKKERGMLQECDGGAAVAWLRDPQGDFTKYEDPKIGCRYLVSVDTCSGEDQQMGGKTADPDWHDVQVWRKGYEDPRDNTFYVPKIVMWHKSQLDSDLLVELIVSASIYYGRCLVVPEVNGEAGLHIIKQLLKRSIPVYRRKRPTQGQQRKTREERMEAYGWRTTQVTRKYIIDQMVEPIREMEVDLSDPQIIDQFESFVVNKKGKAEAMDGCHDDSVISACIGFANLDLAKELMRERRKIDLDRLARDPTYLSPDRFKVDLYGLNKR